MTYDDIKDRYLLGDDGTLAVRGYARLVKNLTFNRSSMSTALQLQGFCVECRPRSIEILVLNADQIAAAANFVHDADTISIKLDAVRETTDWGHWGDEVVTPVSITALRCLLWNVGPSLKSLEIIGFAVPEGVQLDVLFQDFGIPESTALHCSLILSRNCQFKALSVLGSLTSLCVRFNDPPPDLRLEAGTFRCLEKLEIRTAFSVVARVLEHENFAPKLSDASFSMTESEPRDAVIHLIESLSLRAKTIKHLKFLVTSPVVNWGENNHNENASVIVYFEDFKPVFDAGTLLSFSYEHPAPLCGSESSLDLALEEASQLQELILNGFPLTMVTPDIGCRSLSVIKGKCPQLQTLVLYMNPGFGGIPKRHEGASAFECLKKISFGKSPLVEAEVQDVASVLFHLLPQDCELSYGDGTQRDPSHQHWESVQFRLQAKRVSEQLVLLN